MIKLILKNTLMGKAFDLHNKSTVKCIYIASEHLGNGVYVLNANIASGLIALYKPKNILSHPNSRGISNNSLIRAPYNINNEFYMIHTGEISYKLYLLHRLDYSTSGVILISNNEKTALFVKNLFTQQGMIEKNYIAILFGKLQNKKSLWESRIKVSKEQGLLDVKLSNLPFARHAVTSVKALKYNHHKNLSMVELSPKTGITHQLRIQCKENLLPIVGDRIYGNFKLNKLIAKSTQTEKNRLYLHSNRISIDLSNLNILDNSNSNIKEKSNISHKFTAIAPIPIEFNRLIG